MSRTCDVDVWLIYLDGEGEITLSPDEEIRAARLRFERDRVRWIRARSGLRRILGDSVGILPAEIRFVLGPNGKPSVANGDSIEFSLSHSGSWGMVAVTQAVPVGIDIEQIRENVDIADLLRRLGVTELPDTRAGLYTAWNRREAMTKAVGGALMANPVGDFRFLDLEAPEGYSAALALLGYDPVLRCHSTQVL